jgi:Domain of unknown function (DUF4920)/tRNA_anti-like
MKRLFAAVLLAVCAAISVAAQGAQQPPPSAPEPCAEGNKSGPVKLSAVIKRGAAVAEAERVAFADALKAPEKYAGKTVIIEGVAVRVCKKEGCWMEIAPTQFGATVRATFKNHAFFVPKDADGQKFRAIGEFIVRKLDRETVEHLVKEDGAQIKTNPDGTADELTFIATGVELWK